MKFTPETELMMERCKEEGFNLWPMLFIYKRRSKLKPEIPDFVIQEVCKEYLKRAGKIRVDFPYFLEVLKRKTHEYFAKQNINEHEQIKKAPMPTKNIFKMLAEQ